MITLESFAPVSAKSRKKWTIEFYIALFDADRARFWLFSKLRLPPISKLFCLHAGRKII